MDTETPRTRRAVLVAGMHRSGTSAVAGTLARVDVEFGGPLLGAQPDNPRGFYELEPIVQLHDEVLADLGRTWGDPRPVNVELLSKARREEVVAEMAQHLEVLVADVDTAAIKDPRACRLLPLWEEAFVRAEIEPMLLFVSRSAASVVASLGRRSGFAPDAAALLYAGHVVALERDSRSWRRAHVSYRHFLADPVEAIDAVTAQLGLDLPSAADRLAEIQSFVSSELNHDPDRAVLDDISTEVDGILRTIEQWQDSLGIDAAFPVAADLDPLVEPLHAAQSDGRRFAADHATQLYLQTVRESSDLRRELAERGRAISVVDARLDRLSDELVRVIESNDRQIAELRNELRAEAERDRVTVLAAIDVFPTKVDQIREALQQFLAVNAATQDHHRHRIQELDDWLNRVVDDQREHASHILRMQRDVNEIANRRSTTDRVVEKARRAPAGVKRRVQARRLGPVARGPASVVPSPPTTNGGGPAPRTAVVRDPRPPTATGPLPDRIANLAFADVEHPTVSIVIPVFNEVETTVQCLESLRDCPPTVTHEVIIVNDCSTDPGFDALRSIPGLRIVDNPTNSGFVFGCNNGAASATGEYVFFLNNDTQVTVGAIDWLVGTFSSFPNAGAAGSKLVFPDGTVQDAGGIVWRDATAWNYGRGQHPDEPHLNYARSVDYCAGAALMVPKALFDELGGFDDHFAPAYYEDTDLCMRLNQAGYDVIYQAASVVYHHEGKSYGTDVKRDAGKKNQDVNEAKFYERWREALAMHRPNGVEPEKEKERKITKRALVIDARILTPDQDSGSLRMTNILRLLRTLGYRVTFIPHNLHSMEPYTTRMQAMGVEVLTRPFCDDILEYLAANGELFDVAILSRLEVVEPHLDPVRLYCSNATVLYDTVDLHFLRQQREQELTGRIVGGFDADRTRDAELAAMARSDATLVCSPVEQELLAIEAPDAAVYVVGNVHDEATSPTPPNEREGILFVGGFEHPPNVDGIMWFVNDIMPLVVEADPTAVVHIVGSKMPPEVAELAGSNVVVHGYVENLDDLYDVTRLCIAPLRFGAGVKGKLTQPMARGIPCVSTTMGAEGIPVADGESILLADEPADFAEAIAILLRDDALWQRLAEGGEDVVARTFSLDAIKERLRAAIAVKEQPVHTHERPVGEVR